MTALRVVLDKGYAEVRPGAACPKASASRVCRIYRVMVSRGVLCLLIPNQSGTAETFVSEQ